MEELKRQLKQQIIEAINLEDMKPEDIEDTAPLFGEGLGLDSIDALELIMIMDKNYGIGANTRAHRRKSYSGLCHECVG